jgi:hypothetical protein
VGNPRLPAIRAIPILSVPSSGGRFGVAPGAHLREWTGHPAFTYVVGTTPDPATVHVAGLVNFLSS